MDIRFASSNRHTTLVQFSTSHCKNRSRVHHPALLAIDILFEHPRISFDVIPATPTLPIIAIYGNIAHAFEHQVASGSTGETFGLEDMYQIRAVMIQSANQTDQHTRIAKRCGTRAHIPNLDTVLYPFLSGILQIVIRSQENSYFVCTLD